VSGRHDEALGLYASALASADGAMAGKALAAAVRTGDVSTARAAAERLAEMEPSRRDEALAWLYEATRAPIDSVGVLRTLLGGILALDSTPASIAIGRSAATVLNEGVGDEEGLDVLAPGALAASGEPEVTDRLLLRLAQLQERRGACIEASRAYAAVRRRAHEPAAAVQAAEGVVRCALRVGEAALARRDAAVAEQWFRAAISGDSSSVASRAGLGGIGRARALIGDADAARAAFAAAARSAADSFVVVAPAFRDSAVAADTTRMEN